MDEATKTPEWQRATGHPIDGITVYKAIGIYQTHRRNRCYSASSGY